MKAIMLMFDSLRRDLLPPYGCDWTHAPNFRRLAQRAVRFNRSYVSSMPCMPARRELHTGRPNFLHRGWGPLEPFDDSMPELLTRAGIHTHLCTDHYHYFEDGGGTYHGRYSTWDFHRGQEADPWIGQVRKPAPPPNINARERPQDWINRQFMQREEDQPQSRTFRAGLEFIERNHTEDNWFLQIECFDPHEPFFSHRKYKDLYPHDYDGPLFDWPGYAPVSETPEQVRHLRYEYAALMSMCDASLGDVLDAMDRHDLWKDTMLLLWTDHGFMLGEHDCWAKGWMPMYEEVSHTPFFVWDPRSARRNESREALVQPAIDLPPTLLEFFGVEVPKDMLGRSLGRTIADDAPVRDAAIFGYHGRHVNVTDGRYACYRAPVEGEAGQVLYEYTHMPTRMRGFFTHEALREMELAEGFAFTKGCPVMKVPVPPMRMQHGSLLFDIQKDPLQQHPLDDPQIERRMIEHMARLMRQADAPPEQFHRMGIPLP
jgi:arylsulfatase A-like enzyme